MRLRVIKVLLLHCISFCFTWGLSFMGLFAKDRFVKGIFCPAPIYENAGDKQQRTPALKCICQTAEAFQGLWKTEFKYKNVYFYFLKVTTRFQNDHTLIKPALVLFPNFLRKFLDRNSLLTVYYVIFLYIIVEANCRNFCQN